MELGKNQARKRIRGQHAGLTATGHGRKPNGLRARISRIPNPPESIHELWQQNLPAAADTEQPKTRTAFRSDCQFLVGFDRAPTALGATLGVKHDMAERPQRHRVGSRPSPGPRLSRHRGLPRTVGVGRGYMYRDSIRLSYRELLATLESVFSYSRHRTIQSQHVHR